jgi:hypothetical protein
LLLHVGIVPELRKTRVLVSPEPAAREAASFRFRLISALAPWS